MSTPASRPPPWALLHRPWDNRKRTSAPLSMISFTETTIRTTEAWQPFRLGQLSTSRVTFCGLAAGESTSAKPSMDGTLTKRLARTSGYVHRGHMRLLIPPGLAKGADLRRAPDCEMGFAQIYAAGWEAHLLAGIGDPPAVLAKSLESCPRCPSTGLDFHSWRTGMETHAFGRAPLP